MTSQQLLAARAALWRQNAEPILTLEDATQWVESQGFLLFLPRRQQLPAPAPSLVEACLGKLENTPARSVIEDALSLAHRIFATDEVVPLNLFGTLSEEPDFLITREQLPLLLSLRADRNWKTTPGGRTSPLHINIWKLLDEQGALTSDQIRSAIGREVTDAAIRRALVELWGTLRVVPRYQTEETEWKLIKAAFPKESAKGATTAQGSALALFIAGYLRSAIAASEDEITAFLSPVASRSKVREALHALLATRQLGSIALGPKTVYHVAGELPEFPEIVPEITEDENGLTLAPEGVNAFSDPRPTNFEGTASGEAEGEQRSRPYTPREGGFSRDRDNGRPQSDRRPYDRDRGRGDRGYNDRGRNDRGNGGFRPAFSRREDRRDGQSLTSGGAFGEERRPREGSDSYGDRPRRQSFDRPNYDRPQGDRPSFDRPRNDRFGSDRPRREDGERRPFQRSGDREGYQRRDDRGGDRRPSFGSREGGRKPFGQGDRGGRSGGGFSRPRPGGDRPFASRSRFGGDRPNNRPDFGRPKFDRPRFDRPRSDRPGFDRPNSDRPGFDRSRSDRGERGAFDRPRREFSDRKPFDRKPAGRDFGARKPWNAEGREDRPQRRDGEEGGERRSFSRGGDRKPSFGGARGGAKPFGRSGGGAGRGPKPGFGKGPAGQRSGKSFGAGGFGKSSGKPFGARSGKPFGKGPSKGGAGKGFGRGPARGPARGPGFGPARPERRPGGEE